MGTSLIFSFLLIKGVFMGISIGVDETIFRLTKRERVFIYVASCSIDPSDSTLDYSPEKMYQDKNLKKRRENKKPIDLEGIAGFLFGAFSYGSIIRFGRRPDRRDPKFFEEQKELLHRRVLETNSSLILGILNLIRSTGLYENGEKINVVFDGHDMYHIQANLERKLKEAGYRLDNIDLKFIPKGDEIVSLVNTSDAIAYSLRALLDRERSRLRKKPDEKVRINLDERTDIEDIKDLIPYHMESDGWSRRSLERKVA